MPETPREDCINCNGSGWLATWTGNYHIYTQCQICKPNNRMKGSTR